MREEEQVWLFADLKRKGRLADRFKEEPRDARGSRAR
jgi:hypothetical protein